LADILQAAKAPWPLRPDARLFDVVLVVISGFAVQQIAGQVWRVFFTAIPEQVRGAPEAGPSLGLKSGACQIQRGSSGPPCTPASARAQWSLAHPPLRGTLACYSCCHALTMGLQ